MKVEAKKVGDIMAVSVEGTPEEMAKMLLELLPPADKRLLRKAVRKASCSWFPDDEEKKPTETKQPAAIQKAVFDGERLVVSVAYGLYLSKINVMTPERVEEEIKRAGRWLKDRPHSRMRRKGADLNMWLMGWMKKAVKR